MALALIVRLGTLWSTASRDADGGDPFFYHRQANMLAEGHGFSDPFVFAEDGRYVPTAIHPPLYTMWLSVPSFLGAKSIFAHKVMSVLAGTAAVAAIGLIGRRVGGPRVGLAAAVLAALYPKLWEIDGTLWPEGLFVLTTGICVLAAYRWRDRPSLAAALGLGAALGLATLTRGEALLLVPVLVVPLVALRPGLDLRGRLVAGGAVIGSLLVVLAPWTVYNLGRFERPVLVSTNANEVFVYANCEETYEGTFLGWWSYNCQERLRQATGEPPGDASEKAEYWRREGLAYAWDNKGRLPVVVAARIGRVWDVFRPVQNTELQQFEGKEPWVGKVGLGFYWVLVPFAIAGAVIARRRKVPLLPLAAQVVVVTITAMVVYGVVRFRAPAEITIVVLAAVAVVALADRLRSGGAAHQVDAERAVTEPPATDPPATDPPATGPPATGPMVHR